MKYYQQEDHKWIRPVKENFKCKCCDCGLVHTINFRIKNKQIEFQAIRDNRATSQIRRHLKKLVFYVRKKETP